METSGSRRVLSPIAILGGILIFCLVTSSCRMLSGIVGISTETPSPAPSPSASGTPSPVVYASLTPLPGQVYHMTQDTLLAATTYAPIHFITETPSPVRLLTLRVIETQDARASFTAIVCMPAYPDFCIPRNRRPGCQELVRNFTVLAPDPYGYDPDHDGIGCEQP